MLISISLSFFFPFWLHCKALYILHAPDRPTQIITDSRGWCDTLIWYKPWRVPHITFMWRVCLRYNCSRSCSDLKGIGSCPYWCLSLFPKCSLAQCIAKGELGCHWRTVDKNLHMATMFLFLVQVSQRFFGRWCHTSFPYRWGSWIHQNWPFLFLSSGGNIVHDCAYLFVIP